MGALLQVWSRAFFTLTNGEVTFALDVSIILDIMKCAS
jgi:hypothetical protein